MIQIFCWTSSVSYTPKNFWILLRKSSLKTELYFLATFFCFSFIFFIILLFNTKILCCLKFGYGSYKSIFGNFHNFSICHFRKLMSLFLYCSIANWIPMSLKPTSFCNTFIIFCCRISNSISESIHYFEIND